VGEQQFDGMASPPTEGGLIGLASIALFLQSSDKIFTAHSSNCGISFACTNRITARASSSARAKRIGESVRLLQSRDDRELGIASVTDAAPCS